MQLFHLSSFSQVLFLFTAHPSPEQTVLWFRRSREKTGDTNSNPQFCSDRPSKYLRPPLFYFPRSFVDFSVGFFFSFHENFKCKSLIPVWNRNIFEMLVIYLTGKKKKHPELILHCEKKNPILNWCFHQKESMMDELRSIGRVLLCPMDPLSLQCALESEEKSLQALHAVSGELLHWHTDLQSCSFPAVVRMEKLRTAA